MHARLFSIVCLMTLFLGSASFALDPLKRFEPLDPQPAPLDIEFKDLDGDPIKLSDYKGKIVILNFWATWCMPCVSEMPSLNRLAQLYKHDDFVVIAVARDEKGPITPEEFRKRSKFYQMIFAMDREKKGLFDTLEVEGLPTTFILNEDGMIVGKLVGGTNWAHEDVLALMQRYIDGDPPKPKAVPLWERLSMWLESARAWVNGVFKSTETPKEGKQKETADTPQKDDKADSSPDQPTNEKDTQE